MAKEIKLPKVGEKVEVRRKSGFRIPRDVVVTGVGRDSFLGYYESNPVIEVHFKLTELDWS